MIYAHLQFIYIYNLFRIIFNVNKHITTFQKYYEHCDFVHISEITELLKLWILFFTTFENHLLFLQLISASIV